MYAPVDPLNDEVDKALSIAGCLFPKGGFFQGRNS